MGALKKGTQRVRAGDFDYRIHVTSRDEFEDLAESFNVMSAEVRRMLVAVQEKEKLEAELRIARDIQNRLLPQEQPRLTGYEVLGSSMSGKPPPEGTAGEVRIRSCYRGSKEKDFW